MPTLKELTCPFTLRQTRRINNLFLKNPSEVEGSAAMRKAHAKYWKNRQLLKTASAYAAMDVGEGHAKSILGIIDTCQKNSARQVFFYLQENRQDLRKISVLDTVKSYIRYNSPFAVDDTPLMSLRDKLDLEYLRGWEAYNPKEHETARQIMQLECGIRKLKAV